MNTVKVKLQQNLDLLYVDCKEKTLFDWFIGIKNSI